MKSKYILLTVLISVISSQAYTASFIWVGSTNSDWSIASNWTNGGGGTPGSGDNITLNSNAPNNLVLSQNRTVTNFTINGDTMDLGTYNLTITGTATFSGGRMISGTVLPTGGLCHFGGAIMDVRIDASCTYYHMNSGRFLQKVKLVSAGTSSTSGTGGCIFDDSLTISHGGTTYFTMGSSGKDVFNGPVTINNTSTHEVFLATGDSAFFNNNLILNSTNNGGISLGSSGGVSVLASGKTISIGTSGFSNDYLTLKNFKQLGTTSQTLTLTGTAIVNLISCTFNGNLTVSSPGFLIKDNVFNGTTSLTRTASSGNFQSDGNNVFNSAASIDNFGSSGRIRFATTTGDIFNANATFSSSGSQDVQIAYSGNTIFKGNLTINSNKVVFNAASGKVTFAGSNSQTLNGSYNYSFKKLAINKSANNVTANTTLSVDDSLFFVSGNLITTSSNLLTMKAGSASSGASNASFVDGPLKKFGNTGFVFPTGKSGIMGTVEMSAPASISNSFTAEYFNVRQTLGDSLSSNVRFLSNQNYWSFQRVDGTSTVTIKLGWDKSLFDFGIDSTYGKIANWNGAFWNGITSDACTQYGNMTYIKTTSSISSFGFFTVSNIIYGARFTSYITSTGNVEVFGNNGKAQHGNCSLLVIGPSLTYYNPNPALPQSTDENNYCTSPEVLNTVIKISQGWEHTLALKCDKTVVAWGINDENQIGNSNITMNRSLVGVPVESSSNVVLSNIIDIAAGKYNSMAVDDEGYAYYWGYSLQDLIGNTGPNAIFPEKLRINSSSLITNAVAVSAGSDHLVVLLRDGTVRTFGSNTFGQLGVDNVATPNSIYGVQVHTNSGVLSNIIAISAGDRMTLALDKFGDVYAWGFNNNGQLGLGTPSFPYYEKYAQKITTLSDIKFIATQVATCMAIENNNSVYCWGVNNIYQCGQSSNSPGAYDTPVQVTLPSGITDISYGFVGERHCILFSKDNLLVAWGDNLEGQLAIPLSTSSSWPACAYPSSCPTSPIVISNQQNGANVIENPLIPCDEFKNYCYSKFLISSPTIWTSATNTCTSINSGITISDEILIAKGASLTLNSGTYYFGPNGRIILEEGDGTLDGAQLIVNSGATLTGNENCMWKGVEVRGIASYGGSNSRQAKVIFNGGRIEHAHNSVTLGKWDTNYYDCFDVGPGTFLTGFDLTGSGGQIEVDNNSAFTNNAFDIRFAPYTKLSASTIENSHFDGGTLRDPRYLSPSSSSNIFYAPSNSLQRASNAVRQWKNKASLIEGNEFKDYEEALNFTDSRLQVIENSFEDCRVGINTNSTMSVLIYGGPIVGNTFKNVRTDINASGGKYLNIYGGNSFNPDAGSQSANLRGLFFNNERSFSIYDNNFTSLKYAIVITNSGTSGGAIRHNDPLLSGNLFTDCWRSIHLQKNNSWLAIKCNNFDNSSGGSFYNTNWYLNNGTTLANQGWPSISEETSQAGNWFTQAPLLNHISSFSSHPFTYFRHGAGSPDEVIPAAAGTGTINIDANSMAMSSFDDACNPVIIPPNGEPSRLAYFANILDSLNLEMDTLITSIDHQLSDSLISIIDNRYPQDTILNLLRSNGPLSDSVLIKAINTVDALNDTALYEVLFENSPFSNEVFQALNERSPEMDEGLKSLLNQVQGSNPPFVTLTSLNKELDYYNLDKRLLINSYVSRLSSQDSVEKAIQVLDSENSYEDRQTVFGTYVTMGEIDSAAVKLELLLTSGLAETDWLALSEILLSLTSDNKTWFDMTDWQADILRDIAKQDENTLAKIQSQNVLHLVYGDTFPVIIDEEEIYLRQMPHKQEPPTINKTNELQLFPNPANDLVEMRLNNSKDQIEQIVLLNNLGNVVLAKKVNENKLINTLNIEHIPSGLYLVKIMGTEGKTFSSKLMIVR